MWRLKERSLKTTLIKKLVEPGRDSNRRKKEIKESVEYIHQRSPNDKGYH